MSQLLKPHTCYAGTGSEYRGTIAITKSNSPCLPWNRKPTSTSSHLELVGGHNYCRNPSAFDSNLDEPWCFSAQNPDYPEACNIQKCNNMNLYFYVVIPAVVVVAVVTLFIGLCCMKRRTKSQKKEAKAAAVAASNNTMANNGPHATMISNNGQNTNMEMSRLLPEQQQ